MRALLEYNVTAVNAPRIDLAYPLATNTMTEGTVRERGNMEFLANGVPA